jgi:hypothetical protein
METISGPGAAEPGMAPSLNVAEALLGGKGGGVVLRMVADVFSERQRRVRLERRIEADEQRLVAGDTLQPVHPVGHGDVVFRRALALPAQKIPRGPGAAALRHQSGVAMQIDPVGGIADGAEHGAFGSVGVGQHRQRLIAVRGDHDVIVTVAPALAVMDDDTGRRPLDRRHRAAVRTRSQRPSGRGNRSADTGRNDCGENTRRVSARSVSPPHDRQCFAG